METNSTRVMASVFAPDAVRTDLLTRADRVKDNEALDALLRTAQPAEYDRFRCHPRGEIRLKWVKANITRPERLVGMASGERARPVRLALASVPGLPAADYDALAERLDGDPDPLEFAIALLGNRDVPPDSYAERTAAAAVAAADPAHFQLQAIARARPAILGYLLRHALAAPEENGRVRNLADLVLSASRDPELVALAVGEANRLACRHLVESWAAQGVPLSVYHAIRRSEACAPTTAEGRYVEAYTAWLTGPPEALETPAGSEPFETALAEAAAAPNPVLVALLAENPTVGPEVLVRLAALRPHLVTRAPLVDRQAWPALLARRPEWLPGLVAARTRLLASLEVESTDPELSIEALCLVLEHGRIQRPPNISLEGCDPESLDSALVERLVRLLPAKAAHRFADLVALYLGRRLGSDLDRWRLVTSLIEAGTAAPIGELLDQALAATA